ncbi:hypothetical protein [Granulosicoccus antarcticus]|uniref:Uncharacterized protein n=1 Tax=Granulosicoccus antarcticus IMCC3135 TaxID=1192854 RepID=A0A2Z2P0K2_9GAMM|nr:hypothetical protein [Granulosicoccus antarcticus]ASJ73737.1 hypothetical protein IMCC3135_18290 [Granulosicoccus antarcticus IMCC3135]
MAAYKIIASSLLLLTQLSACNDVSETTTDQSSAAEDSVIDISLDLTQRFSQTDLDPEHREAVIVTLTPGTDPQNLQAAGMRIEHTMKNRPIVSGTLNAAAFNDLRSLAGVERIERDGPMKALDP